MSLELHSHIEERYRGSLKYGESDVAVKMMLEGSWDAQWQVGANFEVKLLFCLSASQSLYCLIRADFLPM